MHVIPVDPLILRVWVPFPLDQVLHLVLSSELSGLQDFFNLILLFSIDKVRRGFHKVRSVELSFAIRGQEVYMEDIMDLPLWGKFQLISDW